MLVESSVGAPEFPGCLPALSLPQSRYSVATMLQAADDQWGEMTWG